MRAPQYLFHLYHSLRACYCVVLSPCTFSFLSFLLMYVVLIALLPPFKRKTVVLALPLYISSEKPSFSPSHRLFLPITQSCLGVRLFSVLKADVHCDSGYEPLFLGNSSSNKKKRKERTPFFFSLPRVTTVLFVTLVFLLGFCPRAVYFDPKAAALLASRKRGS